MQDKQKVTLYLPPEIHRQLKIRAAVESEPMSSLAQRAIAFYLSHPHLVDEVDSAHGQTHRVYSCPDCSTQLVIREDELAALGQSASIIPEGLPVETASVGSDAADSQGEELVPC